MFCCQFLRFYSATACGILQILFHSERVKENPWVLSLYVYSSYTCCCKLPLCFTSFCLSPMGAISSPITVSNCCYRLKKSPVLEHSCIPRLTYFIHFILISVVNVYSSALHVLVYFVPFKYSSLTSMHLVVWKNLMIIFYSFSHFSLKKEVA